MTINSDDRAVINDIAQIQAEKVLKEYHETIKGDIATLKTDILLMLESKIDPLCDELKGVRERVHTLANRVQTIEIVGANGNGKKKILTPEGAGMGKKLWNKLLEDVTNSRVYRYSFIILALGIGFGAARKAGVFELGFIKEILAYILGLKVQ